MLKTLTVRTMATKKKMIDISVCGPDNVWTPMTILVDPQQFIKSTSKKKYITSIASNSFIGGNIKDVGYHYNNSQAEKDINGE